MSVVPFVDAHIHLWDLDHLTYPWLTPPFSHDGLMGSVAPIAATYTAADYLRDAARWNPVGAVHVDAGAHADHALAETKWLEQVATTRGLPSGIVAFTRLDDHDAADMLERQAAHPRVRGIRQIVNWHSDPYYTYTPHDLLADSAWEKGFAVLARHGFSFDLQAYPQQLALAVKLLSRHPDIPVIVNHCGMPMLGSADGFAVWRDAMRRLAALPQVSVKISGFGIMNHAWSAKSIRPAVLETIELFGPARCMIASNFPTDRLYADFDTTLGAYDTITAGFTDDERRDLFGRTANRIYRLGLDLSEARPGGSAPCLASHRNRRPC